jgi:hypothetical protein
MSMKLSQLEYKDNFITTIQDIAARLRRLEMKAAIAESPLDYWRDAGTGQLYWDEVVTIRGETFPILIPIELPEDEE